MRLDEARTTGPADVLLAAERWVTVAAGMPAPTISPPRPPAGRQAWSTRNAHHNAHREILLAVRGADWFGMDGRLYPCGPGHLFLIDPGIPHDNYYPETADGLEHIWLRVLGDRVIVNWLRITAGRTQRQHESLAVLSQEQLGVSLGAFPDDTRPLPTTFTTIRLRLLVALIAAHLAEGLTAILEGRGTPPTTQSMQAKVTEAIREHIDDTSGKGVSLEFLAHFSGYSKFHLARFFRRQAGCTIHQYIDAARVRKMKQMKAAGAVNREVAQTLGFSDVAAYLRWRRRLKT